MDGFSSYLTALVVTVIAVVFYIPVAKRIGLMDCPGGRKCHEGAVPLVGGISMFSGLLFSVLGLPISIDAYRALLAGCALMVIIGVMDDLKELSVRIRFSAQVIAALLMILWGDVLITGYGELLYTQAIDIGAWAIPFSVFVVVGIINATNMTDGVDGLAGSMLLVILSAFAFIAWEAGLYSDAMVLMCFISVVLGFLIFNFPFPGRRQAKIFMGDGGSLLLGFVMAWYTIDLCQGEDPAISPAAMLWVAGLPVIDTMVIMTRRVIRGRSPFSADREHFHHILQVAGFGKAKIVLTMMTISGVLASVGIVGEKIGIPSYLLFYGYVIFLALYFWGIMHAWKVMKVIRKVDGIASGESK